MSYKDSLKTIGEGVAIPNLFYKVIFDLDKEEATAYLLSNEKSSMKLSSFVVSIDSIEVVTGIDFFWELDDDVDGRVEQIKYNFIKAKKRWILLYQLSCTN